MGRGLSLAQREIVQAMIVRGASDRAIKEEISRMARWDKWDYNENLRLCRRLAAEGKLEAAKELERLMRS